MTAPDAHNRSTPGNAPVTAPEADALNAWLESITGPRHAERPLRHVERSRDISGRSRSRRASNGHVDPATSLQATAEAFHARLTRAEHEAEPDVPADAIWEKIMASNTIAAPTQNVAGRAADLVSARASRPTRTIPAWLSGSHWAVSAFMLAAVVVGIVALYGSFAGSPGGSGDDPAINPNFAMASPDEPTPAADAVWLQPYSPDECNVEPRTLDEAAAFMRDPGESVPRQYGPVSPVSEELAREVASANRMFQSCDLTGETGEWRAMVSPRLIFEGQGSPYFDTITSRSATYEEFVANHRELSEMLLTDPTRDYTVESTGAIPLREGGLPDYSASDSEIFWSVMLPNDIVLLPDGRIGGPEVTLLPANHEEFQQAIEDIRLATPAPYSYEMVIYRIYAQDPTQDGQWVLDETLALCARGCDAFYAEAEEYYQSNLPVLAATPVISPDVATPSATPDDAAWLAPISPDECDVDARSLEEVAAFIEDPGETVPRDYGIVGPADPVTAAEVSRADRVWHSCNLFEGAAERRAMESPRYIHQESPNALANVSPEEQQATYRAMRHLSEEVISQDYQTYRIDSSATFQQELQAIRNDQAFVPPDMQGTVIVPDQIVTFADGRVGGPVSVVRNPFPEGFDPEASNDYWIIAFHIYSQDLAQNDAWVLDQRLDLCIGECDSVWTAYEQVNGLALNTLATPSATPESATPGSGNDWLAPIAPDECDVAETRALGEVGAIVQDPDQIVPREYSPVTEVEAPLAQDVAGANRAWESCRAQGLIGERRAVESLRYVAEIEPYNAVSPHNAETYDDWVSLNETMRASFLDPDVESYLVESEALPPFDCETGYGESDLSAQVSHEIIQPQHLVQLPDGRIGGPVTSLVGSGFLQCLETRPPAMSSGYQVAYIHIFAQDPTRDNRWALDERFSICVTGCDDYYEETAYLSAYLYPPWPATPEAATPVAGTAALQPILPEECDVEALAAEQVSAITQLPGEETERSYAPTGPVHDALDQEIVEADRAWQSCYVYGSADERAALQSPRLTRDGPGERLGSETSREAIVANLDRFDASRELGEFMLSGDWRDYFIESDLFAIGTPAALQTPDFIPTVPIPGQALHLADGRVAITIAQLVAPGASADQFIDGEDIPYWWIPVHILTQDPAQDGRWVADETLTICMGDCDLARASIVDYIDYLDSLVPISDDATPAATPQTRRDWLAV